MSTDSRYMQSLGVIFLFCLFKYVLRRYLYQNNEAETFRDAKKRRSKDSWETSKKEKKPAKILKFVNFLDFPISFALLFYIFGLEGLLIFEIGVVLCLLSVCFLYWKSKTEKLLNKLGNKVPSDSQKSGQNSFLVFALALLMPLAYLTIISFYIKNWKEDRGLNVCGPVMVLIVKMYWSVAYMEEINENEEKNNEKKRIENETNENIGDDNFKGLETNFPSKFLNILAYLHAVPSLLIGPAVPLRDEVKSNKKSTNPLIYVPSIYTLLVSALRTLVWAFIHNKIKLDGIFVQNRSNYFAQKVADFVYGDDFFGKTPFTGFFSKFEIVQSLSTAIQATQNTLVGYSHMTAILFFLQSNHQKMCIFSISTFLLHGSGNLTRLTKLFVLLSYKIGFLSVFGLSFKAKYYTIWSLNNFLELLAGQSSTQNLNAKTGETTNKNFKKGSDRNSTQNYSSGQKNEQISDQNTSEITPSPVILGDILNIHPVMCEIGTMSQLGMFWNVYGNLWLRKGVYERVLAWFDRDEEKNAVESENLEKLCQTTEKPQNSPKKKKKRPLALAIASLSTFLTSALWHGIRPGYAQIFIGFFVGVQVVRLSGEFLKEKIEKMKNISRAICWCKNENSEKNCNENRGNRKIADEKREQTNSPQRSRPTNIFAVIFDLLSEIFFPKSPNPLYRPARPENFLVTVFKSLQSHIYVNYFIVPFYLAGSDTVLVKGEKYKFLDRSEKNGNSLTGEMEICNFVWNDCFWFLHLWSGFWILYGIWCFIEKKCNKK